MLKKLILETASFIPFNLGAQYHMEEVRIYIQEIKWTSSCHTADLVSTEEVTEAYSQVAFSWMPTGVLHMTQYRVCSRNQERFVPKSPQHKQVYSKLFCLPSTNNSK